MIDLSCLRRYSPFAKFEISGDSNHREPHVFVGALMVEMNNLTDKGEWVRYDDVLSLLVKQETTQSKEKINGND
jgi:hypothetical protein